MGAVAPGRGSLIVCLGIPGRVLAVHAADPLARVGTVSFGAEAHPVNLTCVPDAGPGAWVLVTAGFAVATVDEAVAQRLLEVWCGSAPEQSGPGR